MTTLEHRLLEQWPKATPERIAADLLRLYGEPHRHYHDLRHLDEVLTAVDLLATYAVDVDGVRLAVWFHDAAYEPGAADNEDRSAALAQAALPPPLAERVAALVRLTADHAPPRGDADAAVLCDADLAILAASPDRYDEYAADVRREHAHVPDNAFRHGRTAVLTGFLARDRIYTTDAAYALWEQRARRNVRRELNSLGAGATRRR